MSRLEMVIPSGYRRPVARERITRTRIDQVAIRLVDRDGFEALTLSQVAAELDVGPSALYTHVDGLEGLRRLVAVSATTNLTTCLRTAAIGNAGTTAVLAMGAAYRQFLHDHPGQFASTMAGAADETNDELAAATDDLLQVFALVFAASGHGPEEADLAARSTRSAIHGFCALEHASGTTDDHTAAYEHLLATLQRGLDRPTD